MFASLRVNRKKWRRNRNKKMEMNKPTTSRTNSTHRKPPNLHQNAPASHPSISDWYLVSHFFFSWPGILIIRAHTKDVTNISRRNMWQTQTLTEGYSVSSRSLCFRSHLLSLDLLHHYGTSTTPARRASPKPCPYSPWNPRMPGHRYTGRWRFRQ